MPWEGDTWREPEPGNEPDSEACDDEEAQRLAARRFYLDAPPFRIDFELDGTVTLGMKHYEWCEGMSPEEATRWRPISRHADLEEAERRLRHVCAGPHFYDAQGRVVSPTGVARTPPWPLPPED